MMSHRSLQFTCLTTHLYIDIILDNDDGHVTKHTLFVQGRKLSQCCVSFGLKSFPNFYESATYVDIYCATFCDRRLRHFNLLYSCINIISLPQEAELAHGLSTINSIRR